MSEKDNYFISSRGILKSCDFHSNTPMSSIRTMIGYNSINSIKHIHTPSIYVTGSAVLYFVQNVLPSINFNFILVSGDCDENIPYDILNEQELNTLLENKYLKHWFSQNMTLKHSKITIIPIGLDYHTLTGLALWGPIASCKQQETTLKEIINKSKPFFERKIKCYSNFHFSMNTRLSYDRRDAIKQIDSNIIDYENKKINRIMTWYNQIQYAFVISPHGGGLDCHRTWEALCLGCIPIVKTSMIDDLYTELPVLIVNEWSDVTYNLLFETSNKYKIKYMNNEFNMKKLSLSYWIEKINIYKLYISK